MKRVSNILLHRQIPHDILPWRHHTSLPRKKGWESVIGLEVHAQIQVQSKLFSPAGISYGGSVNNQVALFDVALPGTLPVINRNCVEAAVLTALHLGCKINSSSSFDRKHYFYADSPAGYQITQQRRAVANSGVLDFLVYSTGVHKQPYRLSSKVRQLQLEQDSGKSLHDADAQRSLIDFNRAGIALMEIVFDSDLHDGEEAGALVKELMLILKLIETCDCKMEEGSLRVDANVSVNRIGEPLGTRTEVKNISSIRSVVNAIEFEVKRQIKLIEEGSNVINETRSFDAHLKQTLPMRDKEVLQDYRFMPEPNLPDLKLIYDPHQEITGAINIANIQKRMRELPDITRRKLVQLFGLRMEMAIIIVNTPGFLKYFLSVMENLPPSSGSRAATLLQTDLMELLNLKGITLKECNIPPLTFGVIVDLMVTDRINIIKAKEVLACIFNGDDRSPEKIVEEEGWFQVMDDNDIRNICERVINENQKLASDYKSKGKAKYLNVLVGLVKKLTDGKYNMKKVAATMQELLKKV